MKHSSNNVFSKNIQLQSLNFKYNSARGNLLLVFLFTIINILLFVTESNVYFLFSAFLPYFIVDIAYLLCGKYPVEFYTDELSDMVFFDDTLYYIAIVIAVVMALVYVLAWLLSGKNRVGWLIFSLVIFSVDTLLMFILGGFQFDYIFDIIFHALVILSLSVGIKAHFQRRALEAEINEETLQQSNQYEDPSSIENDYSLHDTQPLRVADFGVKSRIFLQADSYGMIICYRRVKKTNELVINNYVYDDTTGFIETDHSLNAIVKGHIISVGLSNQRSFISVDGIIIATKIRWF
ncbi:MAG: hypothetical protein IKA74_06110 [Clostridia bacterium]|nr:hypothetical protein [Clostridia bacterium]